MKTKIVPQCEPIEKRYLIICPFEGKPVTAVQVGYYRPLGRATGLRLRLPSGREVDMTFTDLTQRQTAASEVDHEK